jgi:DNA-binding MarR family transcriptional regulator
MIDFWSLPGCSRVTRSSESPVTAGRLSQQSGLTTGAITHILDRLEKRGYIQRVRDTTDRRRVFVKTRTDRLKALLPKYEAIGAAYMAMLDDYNIAELELICGYLERACEISKQQISKLWASRSGEPMVAAEGKPKDTEKNDSLATLDL